MSLLRPIVFALLLALLAPAAASAAKKPSYYVSLGDSLAAGYQKTADGTVVYRPGYTAGVLKRGKRSIKRLKLRNFGCPGENLTTFVATCPDPGKASKPSQLGRAVRFMRANRGRVKLVTVSIGANQFTPCSKGGGIDLSCVGAGKQALEELLPQRLATIRRAAGRRAKIAVLALYNPYLVFGLQPAPYNAVAETSAQLAESINETIAAAAEELRMTVADGYRAFGAGALSETTTYDGRTVPVAVANVCRFTQQCLPAPQANIHPTDSGYARLAAAFIRALKL